MALSPQGRIIIKVSGARGSIGPKGDKGNPGSGGGDSSHVLVGDRLPGETDDTQAVHRAMMTAKLTGLPLGFEDPETREYRMGVFGQNAVQDYEGNLVSGVRFVGVGAQRARIRKTKDFPYIFFTNPAGIGPSGNPNIQGPVTFDVHFEWIEFWDDVAALGFSEQECLLHLAAVKNVGFENCKFVGWRGDAVYWSHGDIGDVPTGGKQVRHNQACYMYNCHFDGVNMNNRQAFSLADMDGFIGENLWFENCTRPGGGGVVPYDPFNPNSGFPMPACIDLEPNAPLRYAICRNIVLRNLYAKNCGGSVVACFFGTNNDPANIVVPMKGVVIENVFADNVRRGPLQVFGDENATIGFDVTLRGGVATNCFRPYELLRFRGLTIENYTWRRCRNAGLIGVGNDTHRDLTFRNCLWEECGLDEGVTTVQLGGNGITYDGCIWRNCNGIALAFRDKMLSNAVFRNCKWQNDAGAAANMSFSLFVIGNTGEEQNSVVNRMLDTTTISVKDCEFNGIPTFNFPVKGMPFRAPPTAGRWVRGDTVNAPTTFKPGSPRRWYAINDSAAGATADFVVDALVPGGAPDSAPAQTTNFALPNGLAYNQATGRLTATANMRQYGYGGSTTLYASGPNDPNGFGIEAFAPYAGSNSIFFGAYLGDASVNPGGIPADETIGLVFRGDIGQVSWIYQGALFNAPFSSFDLGDRFRVRIKYEDGVTRARAYKWNGSQFAEVGTSINLGSARAEFRSYVRTMRRDDTFRINYVGSAFTSLTSTP